MSIPSDYTERVYAGWYGKIIGVRHGANVEGWSYDKIREQFGEISTYPFDFKNFAADDDTNGPIFFIRALSDYVCSEDLTPRQMGETVLNYVPDGHGFFWWGGYGVSTEHTAFQNLTAGIDAPLSGSIELNGPTVAEQIGGQIFIDVWGLVSPCSPDRAARFAKKMASVTHGGNGIYGGMFVAACVSAAFAARNVKEVIDAGLAVIPADCEYRRMADAVLAFHGAHPEDWRACFAYVKDHFGYDRYPGACHIIPNSAVVLLSLLYSGGSFSRAINISVMCGWDTDCNAANVGCIMGVLTGLEGIDKSWRAPINDFLATSSVLSCMNLRDVANDALYLASLGCRIAGEGFPAPYQELMAGAGPRFAFALPESTHTFRAQGRGCSFENVPCKGAYGGRCLRAVPEPGEGPVRLYRQTFYRPGDFSDDRYTPSFAPEVFPGQTVTLRVRTSEPAVLRAFAHDVYADAELYGEPAAVDGWTELRLDLPASDGCIEKVGVELPAGCGAVVDIDWLTFSGPARYTLNFAKAGQAVWNFLYAELGQTSHSKGRWELWDHAAYGSCADHGELFTGSTEFTDYTVTARIRPETGREHMVIVRAQGAIRGYFAGFSGDRLVILKNQRGLRTLAELPFAWENGRGYALTVTAEGDRVTLAVDGQPLLAARDEESPYLSGCYGMALRNGSRCRIEGFDLCCEK